MSFATIIKKIGRYGMADLAKRVSLRVRFKLAGVDFSAEQLPLDGSILNVEHGHMHAATGHHYLLDILNSIYEYDNSIKSGSFVDLGSGKGATLFTANVFGMEKIYGVEFIDQFCKIAEANMKNLKLVNVKIINTDATKFTFPEDTSIIFMFNPFDEQILSKVLDHIMDINKRVYLIYINAIHRNHVETAFHDHQIIFDDPFTLSVVYELQ